MKKLWFSAGLALALGTCQLPCWAQISRSRDISVTGPGGRTLQRSISRQRGPGFVDRQVSIQRPGGSFQTHATAIRSPRGPVPYSARGYVPTGHRGGFGPRGPVVVERNIVVDRGPGWGTALAVGGGLFGLGMFAGSALASPPPPVYVAQPAPVYVAPVAPPTVVYTPPQPYVPVAQAPAETVVVDPVANAIGRLSSNHDNSRIEGAYTLGRLRDPRAVAPLADRLRNDWDKDVRVAAANALGEIGDPRASEPLRQASALDNRQVVRDAAGMALSRLAVTSQPAVQATEPTVPVQSEPDLNAPLTDDTSGVSEIPRESSQYSPTSAQFKDVIQTPPPPPRPLVSPSTGR